MIVKNPWTNSKYQKRFNDYQNKFFRGRKIVKPYFTKISWDENSLDSVITLFMAVSLAGSLMSIGLSAVWFNNELTQRGLRFSIFLFKSFLFFTFIFLLKHLRFKIIVKEKN